MHASLIASGGKVLDMASGPGRNACWLATQGFQVEAVDISALAIAELAGLTGIETRIADLENATWPYGVAEFDSIVVCRYLHRPLFPKIKQSLKTGGVLIYETFMQGQAKYGRPSNPDFLLMPGELEHIFGNGFSIRAFEQGLLEHSPTAMLQRICAIKS